MPFLDHLEELRWRLFKVLLALAIGFAIAFGLLSTETLGLLSYMQRPLQDTISQQLVYTSPTDPFNVVISASLGLGLFMALPVIFYQIWAFLAPALYQNEKRVVIPVLAGGAVLFGCGVALAFYFVLPVTLKFLVGFQTEAFTPMLEVRRYFGFVFGMCLAFGAAFELPIVILALTAVGLVTPQMLKKFRRHAFVGCIALAALISPGDAITATGMMSVPLYFLYEGGIVLSRIVYRRKQRAQQIGSEAIA